MKKRQIANIVNFVRACEPRAPLDLAEPVICQLELMKKHSLPGTFLLQYDALIDPKFSGLFADTGVSLPQMHIQRNRLGGLSLPRCGLPRPRAPNRLAYILPKRKYRTRLRLNKG
jgi:hypothetical protein